MQKPNFTNELYRVTLWPGKDDERSPEASWVAVPARYTGKSVMTANGRRVSLEKLGKFEIIAESHQTTIYRGYVRDKGEIAGMVMQMHQKLQALLWKKLEAIQKQQLGTLQEPIIKERPYEP